MSKASFVSLLVWELRLAKNFPIDLTDPVCSNNADRIFFHDGKAVSRST